MLSAAPSHGRQGLVAVQLILFSVSPLGAASDQATDERKGRTIVQMNCATCHAIGRQGDSQWRKHLLSAICTSATLSKTFRRRSGKGLLLVTPRCRSSSSNRSRWTKSSITSRHWSDNEPSPQTRNSLSAGRRPNRVNDAHN